MIEIERISEELEESREEIDDIVNEIGEVIMSIAADNDDFICTACIRTARDLWKLLEAHAREEDAEDILEQFAHKTGISLNE